MIPVVPPPHTVSFDRIARAYRWLEYVTLGPLLERTRLHFLPSLLDRRKALVLGDGDGRFVAELLRRNEQNRADAVDTSATMLALLQRRVDPTRVTVHRQRAQEYIVVEPVDLIATHFFLDCLPQHEVDALVQRLAKNITPGGLWVVSEFRIPPGPMRLPAQIYVGMLYRIFGLLTGLAVRSLPDYASSMTAAGLTRIASHRRLLGLLTSELWRMN